MGSQKAYRRAQEKKESKLRESIREQDARLAKRKRESDAIVRAMGQKSVGVGRGYRTYVKDPKYSSSGMLIKDLPQKTPPKRKPIDREKRFRTYPRGSHAFKPIELEHWDRHLGYDTKGERKSRDILAGSYSHEPKPGMQLPYILQKDYHPEMGRDQNVAIRKVFNPMWLSHPGAAWTPDMKYVLAFREWYDKRWDITGWGQPAAGGPRLTENPKIGLTQIQHVYSMRQKVIEWRIPNFAHLHNYEKRYRYLDLDPQIYNLFKKMIATPLKTAANKLFLSDASPIPKDSGRLRKTFIESIKPVRVKAYWYVIQVDVTNVPYSIWVNLMATGIVRHPGSHRITAKNTRLYDPAAEWNFMAVSIDLLQQYVGWRLSRDFYSEVYKIMYDAVFDSGDELDMKWFEKDSNEKRRINITYPKKMVKIIEHEGLGTGKNKKGKKIKEVFFYR